MFNIVTLEDLQARLKAENLPYSAHSIIAFEKKGLLIPPSGTKKMRLYSQGEVEYIVRILKDYYSTVKRKSKYKAPQMEENKQEPPNS